MCWAITGFWGCMHASYYSVFMCIAYLMSHIMVLARNTVATVVNIRFTRLEVIYIVEVITIICMAELTIHHIVGCLIHLSLSRLNIVAY